MKRETLSPVAATPRRPRDRQERKQMGLEAQANYPAGYNPAREHPVLYCRASDRLALKARLSKEPWKTWYEDINRPFAQAALAAAHAEELRQPGFALKAIPIERPPIKAVHAADESSLWRLAIANCALAGFLEEDERCLAKTRELLMEIVDANWCGFSWGDDYESGVGHDPKWMANTMLLLAYDLVGERLTSEERRRFEARVARDLEWAQVDGISPQQNGSWFNSVFVGVAALLLGREDYVRKIEGLLDVYVDEVLVGNGEYYEGANYQTGCMELPSLMLIQAIRNVTGRNPADNPRWAVRAEHWIRRASPVGSDVTHSDANLVSVTGHELLASVSSLPPDVAAWAVWLYNRIGDPGWFHLLGNDEERRGGGLGADPTDPPQRRRRYPYPETSGNPIFWLMAPDPLPAPAEPPPGSYVDRFAGMACLRTSWALDAMYTFFFAPRFYSRGNVHSRWDCLTFDFWAHGAYLVKNAGYGETIHPAPNVPKHLTGIYGVEPKPFPISPPPPFRAFHELGRMVDGNVVDEMPGWWDPRKTYRMSPEAANVPTIDGGGGSHWESRANPMHYVTDTGWVQILRCDGGFGYTRYSTVGTDGKVIRAILQVEPDADGPGYLVVVDDVLPHENPRAWCNWRLHPRGEHAGEGSRHYWTTPDFLNFPPHAVRLEVLLPAEGIAVALKHEPGHILSGSFQLGTYLDAGWQGPRRFWAALRPCPEGRSLPAARHLPDNLGLRIGDRDLLLVRRLDQTILSHQGIETDSTAALVRGGASGFWAAVAGRRLTLADGSGFEASTEMLITSRGPEGALFVDRPHKQQTPMTPARLVLRGAVFSAGRSVWLDGQAVGRAQEGTCEVTVDKPGLHRWHVE